MTREKYKVWLVKFTIFQSKIKKNSKKNKESCSKFDTRNRTPFIWYDYKLKLLTVLSTFVLMAYTIRTCLVLSFKFLYTPINYILAILAPVCYEIFTWVTLMCN